MTTPRDSFFSKSTSQPKLAINLELNIAVSEATIRASYPSAILTLIANRNFNELNTDIFKAMYELIDDIYFLFSGLIDNRIKIIRKDTFCTKIELRLPNISNTVLEMLNCLGFNATKSFVFKNLHEIQVKDNEVKQQIKTCNQNWFNAGY